MLRQHRGGLASLFLIIFVSSRVSSQEGPDLQSSNGEQSQTPSLFFYQRSEYPRDCHEVLSKCSSSSSDGVYLIKPDGYHEPFEVYCNNSLGDGGWMIIQRRHDDSINFNRTWGEYETGFGFLSQEFWLGNKRISYITNQEKYQLRIDITTLSGFSFFVTYDSFRISDGCSNYKLVSTGEYNGVADTYFQWCPTNQVFNNCKCEGSCAVPNCTTSCSNTPGCLCPDGFLMDGDDCIPRENCGCYLEEADAVLEEGAVYVNSSCTERCFCNSSQLSCETYQCSPDANCDEQEGSLQCYCNTGYTGDGVQCSQDTSSDCHGFIGDTSNSIHLIQPAGWTNDPFHVTCDVSDGGGWLVFQRRVDNSESFYRYWNEYKAGFGSVDGNFWLGNDQLAALTSQGSYELRIDLVSQSGQHYYAKYSSFSVGNEGTNYVLGVSGYDSSSTVGYDSMNYHNGRPFTTRDRDNDDHSGFNCASYVTTFQSAWWFGSCYQCDLNAPYTGTGVMWTISWNNLPGDSRYHIQSTEMKIRPLS